MRGRILDGFDGYVGVGVTDSDIKESRRAASLTDEDYSAEWSPGPMFFPNPGYANNFVFKAMPRRWGVDLNYRF